MSVTTPCAPGGRRSRVGFAINGDACDPLDRGRDLDGDTPGGDVADGDPATAFQPGSSAAPKPTAAGSAITSAALAAVASTTPAPCAALGLSGVGVAVPTRTPFNAAASSPGRICASTAAAPPAIAAAALEPLIVPYRADSVWVCPRIEVTSSTPAIATSGLTPPPKARPCEKTAQPRASRSFACQPGAPSETLTSETAGESRPHRGRDRGGQPDDGHVKTVVEAERSSRTSPSTRIAAAPARTASRASSVGPVARRAARRGRRRGCTRGCRSSGEQSPARPGRGVTARPRDAERQRRARRGRACERKLSIEQDAETGADDDSDRRGVTAQVCRADGERRGSPTRAADAAVVGACGPSFPAGTTTSMSSWAAPATARATGPSANEANGSVTPTTAMRAASRTSPSASGSTARSRPASSWSVRP